MDELDVDIEWVYVVAPAHHNEWPEPHRFFLATLSDTWVGLECVCGHHWYLRRDENAILYLQESSGLLKPAGRSSEHFRLRIVSEAELPRVVGE